MESLLDFVTLCGFSSVWIPTVWIWVGPFICLHTPTLDFPQVLLVGFPAHFPALPLGSLPYGCLQVAMGFPQFSSLPTHIHSSSHLPFFTCLYMPFGLPHTCGSFLRLGSLVGSFMPYTHTTYLWFLPLPFWFIHHMVLPYTPGFGFIYLGLYTCKFLVLTTPVTHMNSWTLP